MIFRNMAIIFLLVLLMLTACPENAETPTGIYIDNVTINEGNFSLLAGQTKKLSVTIIPVKAPNKNINWTSSNTNTATVNDSGLVTAHTKGETTITATAHDGSNKSCSIMLTVMPPGGSITPEDIFSLLKGKRVTTNGWADLYDDGYGLSYSSPQNCILLDDAAYPNPPDKRQVFTNAINNENAKFIIVSGDIDLSDGRITDTDHSYFDQFNPASPYRRINGDISFNIGSNTTIIGIDNARLMFGGLNISNKSNIIIRNITFWDAHGSTANDTGKPGYTESKASATALQIGDSGVIGLWVDHCKFTDGTCNDMVRNYNHDGAFDIKKGNYITVSWTEFTNHDKVMLVGSNETQYLTIEDREITLHHNYFHNTTQRMPRTRGTHMHVYNNFYTQIGVSGNNGSCMGPGLNARFIVENNYFDTGSFFAVGTRIVDYKDNEEPYVGNPDYFAVVYNTGNNLSIPWSIKDPDWGYNKHWEPVYMYTLDDNTMLPALIPASAGPVLFNGN